MKRIYLDNASTTKVNKEVIKSMLISFEKDYGNPSSTHALGEISNKAINEARKIIANELSAKSHEIIFTSGATESNNLAILGISRANPNKKTIIISNIEHPSINEVCNYLQTLNYKIIRIPVNMGGIVNLNILDNEIRKNRKNILLVSIMHVNNIMGTIQDIGKIGNICKSNNVLFHTDAVQSFGKLKIDVKNYKIDLLSASGHKIGAPKGIGFIFVKENVKIKPLLFGGGQERDLRSGTENVQSIIGFAKALTIIKKVDNNKIKNKRDKLMINLEKLGGIVNGSKEFRIFNNIHVSFPKINSQYLIQYLSDRGIYVSSGSACEHKKEREDHVLNAINLDQNFIGGSIRITLNEDISEKDIIHITKKIADFLKNVKLI